MRTVCLWTVHDKPCLDKPSRLVLNAINTFFLEILNHPLHHAMLATVWHPRPNLIHMWSTTIPLFFSFSWPFSVLG